MGRKYILVKVVLIVVLWAFLGSILYHALKTDWAATWHALKVPAMGAPFADLRGIPPAVEFSKKGLDPYKQKIHANVPPPYLPVDTAFDYPRVWIFLFSTFQITQERIVLVGLIFASIYLICIAVLILRTQGLLGSFLVFGGALSGASLLGIERGNNDIFVFSLVFVGVQSSILVTFLIFIGAAIILKFYPVAGLVGGILIRRERLAIIVAIAVAFLYFWTQRVEIAEVSKNVPTSFGLSYGVRSIAAGIIEFAPTVLKKYLNFNVLLVSIFLVLSSACALSAWAGIKWASSLVSSELPKSIFCYMIFAVIFLATFLINPNYEYRLIYLIPTLPFYAALWENKATRKLAWVAIVLIFIGMNSHLGGQLVIWKALSHFARTLIALVTAFTFGYIIYSLGLFHIEDLHFIFKPFPPAHRLARNR